MSPLDALHDSPRRPQVLSKLRELHRRFGTIVSSNYDISDICNLKCEGCLYFSGLAYAKRETAHSLDTWDDFFRSEASRGINFGYFAGAEPSLAQEVLRAASRHIPKGVIFTNGIKRIDEDIRYRIHISLWGDKASSQALRGADNVRKALDNYRSDARAICVSTITRHNIDEISSATTLCADSGMPITFSYFSPTDDYLARLGGTHAGPSDYFRISSKEDNLALGPEDFLRAHHAIVEARASFPDHVWYSLEYDKWVTQAGGIYRLDEQGIAMDCRNRLSARHRHFNVDQSLNTGKCCSPNISCRDCRAYAQGYVTLLSRPHQFSKTAESFGVWADVWELWMRIFMLPDT